MAAIDFHKIGEGGGIFVRPLIHNDIIYFGACDKYFYAVDINTGKEAWTMPVDGQIMSSAALWNGTLFFGCFDNHLYAVSIKENFGNQRVPYFGSVQRQSTWKLRTGGIVVSSPLAKDGVIYFGSCDGYFYAVSAESREVIWKVKTGDEIFGDAAIDADKIYIGSTDKHLYCLGLDGSAKWKFRADGEFLIGAPCVSGNVVYAADSEGKFYALDKNTGSLLWNFRSGEEAYNCISSDEKNVYFGSRDRYLYAFDKKTHAIIWKFRANMGMAIRPTVAKDRIYVGSDKVYSLDKKGNLVWAFRSSENEDAFSFSYSPEVYGNRLYFTAFDGHLRCLDMDGNLVWDFRTKSPRGVKLAPGALKPVSWWDEKMFSVFEGGIAIVPPEPPKILKKYGMDMLTALEEQNENKYAIIDNAYGKLQNRSYADNPATYVDKRKKKKDEAEMEKLFRL